MIEINLSGEVFAPVFAEREGAVRTRPGVVSVRPRVRGEGASLGEMVKLMARTSLPVFMGAWKPLRRLRLARPVIGYM